MSCAVEDVLMKNLVLKREEVANRAIDRITKPCHGLVTERGDCIRPLVQR